MERMGGASGVRREAERRSNATEKEERHVEDKRVPHLSIKGYL